MPSAEGVVHHVAAGQHVPLADDDRHADVFLPRPVEFGRDDAGDAATVGCGGHVDKPSVV
jgi:hypothetical protein